MVFENHALKTNRKAGLRFVFSMLGFDQIAPISLKCWYHVTFFNTMKSLWICMQTGIQFQQNLLKQTL